MATLAELIKGFRLNVREGYPTTLTFTGNQLHLTCENPKGYVGISTKPSHKEIEIIFTAAQNEELMRVARLEAEVAIMDALKQLVSSYICYNNADQNLIRSINFTIERINKPYLAKS